MQLDELQPQPRDPRDEAVQRRLVGHRSREYGASRRLGRGEWVKRLQQASGQPAGDLELYSVVTSLSCLAGASAPVRVASAVIVGAVR